jgi:hypothetical protein
MNTAEPWLLDAVDVQALLAGEQLAQTQQPLCYPASKLLF